MSKGFKTLTVTHLCATLLYMKHFFNDFSQIQHHLDGLGLFHMDMGLDRMRRALTLLDLAHPPFVTVQILGTNGKGSTAAFLSALCQSHGLRTGLYTSPHFVSPTERIRIDGHPWPQKLWPAQADKVMNAVPELTYFEFLTVLALLAFREEQVDVAVLEAGLGGSHDATTAVSAGLTCFTPIAMDHKDVLGADLAAIARDKAGAIRPGVPVCAARQFPQAARVLENAAAACKAPLIWAAPLKTSFVPGLAGPHQRDNAALALTAWQRLAPMLGKNPADAALQQQGLARTFIPGRLQAIPATDGLPPLLLDGAHNPHGMAALVNALHQTNVQPAAVIFSCLGDKDWRSVAGMLKKELGHTPVFVPALDNPRAAQVQDVADFFNATQPVTHPVTTLATALALPAGAASAQDAHGSTLPGNIPHASLAQALALAAHCARASGSNRPVLITGSLYLLAEFFSLFPRHLSPTAAPSGRSPHE